MADPAPTSSSYKLPSANMKNFKIFLLILLVLCIGIYYALESNFIGDCTTQDNDTLKAQCIATKTPWMNGFGIIALLIMIIIPIWWIIETK